MYIRSIIGATWYLAMATTTVCPAFGSAAEADAARGKTSTGKPCVVIFDGKHLRCEPIKPKTLFVTSNKYDGDLQTAGMGLNGLQGADNICNAHAVNGIVPPGHYVAWLSTDSKNAKDRLPENNSGYVLPSGTLVATDKAALVNAEFVDLLSPINQDEFGSLVEFQAVWTGTNAGGTSPVTRYNCLNWTLNESGVESGTAGETLFTDREWTIKWSVTCLAELRLYCIER